MTVTWPNVSGFATGDLAPAALGLLDEVYVIGMLRAVIPRAGDGWEELVTLVLMHERGEVQSFPASPKAFKRLTNGQGSAFIVARAAHNVMRTGGDRVGYRWFAEACDNLLCAPEDAPGEAWRRAVNSLVEGP